MIAKICNICRLPKPGLVNHITVPGKVNIQFQYYNDQKWEDAHYCEGCISSAIEYIFNYYKQMVKK